MIRLAPYLAAFVAGTLAGMALMLVWLDYLFGGTGLRVEHRRALDGGVG